MEDKTALGLEGGKVSLARDHEHWSRHYSIEKGRLLEAIGSKILDIQHVGSTSIPGVPAKPILDIAVAVTDFDEASECIEPLRAIGYIYRGEHGIPRRHYFVRDEPRTHQLHLLEVKSQVWSEIVLFRDMLRAHPELAERYAQRKLELALEFPDDRASYQAAKDDVVEQILAELRGNAIPRATA